MSFLIEIARNFFGGNDNKAIVATSKREGESDWQGSESFKYKEWNSPDGKRTVITTICGGDEYGGTFMKDIRLIAKNEEGSFGEMMRVQVVTEPNSEETKYNVYLDAITEKGNGDYFLTDIAYFHEDNGVMHKPFSWSYPTQTEEGENFSEQIAEARAAGIHHMSEILPEIDIEATVVSFINQIDRLDFSKPILVPKQPPLTENSAPLLMANPK